MMYQNRWGAVKAEKLVVNVASLTAPQANQGKQIRTPTLEKPEVAAAGSP